MRGGILDETAVLVALERGELAGAALDVLIAEPPTGALSRLVRHPRVIASPHVAWLSDGATVRLRAGAVQNLLEWLEHGRCRNAVVTV